MSPITRIICGVLGVGGIAAIAFNANSTGGIAIDFAFISSIFGVFVFLYVALFGASPWRESVARDNDERKMTRYKWQLFWVSTIAFLAVATAFLAKKGVFDEANLVVLVMIGFLFALVGVALYFYIKDRPEDIHR